MMSIQRATSLVLIGTGILILNPGAAQAQSERRPATKRERFAQLLALRQAPGRPAISMSSSDPGFDGKGVENFNRRLARQGLTPPPIPPALRVRPLPPTIDLLSRFRRNYVLSLYRFRGLRRGGFAGGLFFTPPAGTPFYPVQRFNIFTYFPVFRAV